MQIFKNNLQTLNSAVTVIIDSIYNYNHHLKLLQPIIIKFKYSFTLQFSIYLLLLPV